GHIPQPPSRKNPEGLPIGFVLDDNPRSVGDAYALKRATLGPNYQISDYPVGNKWLGLTCAACHTNEIHFQGKAVRIDGGASLADHEMFEFELAGALRATHTNDAKFLRFAKRLAASSGQPFDEVAAKSLRRSVVAYTGTLESVIARNRAPHRYGYARLDAFGAILNQVVSAALEIPENSRPANAPVSFPFVWDTPKLDWVQWNSSAGNPIARNVGEVLGVFAHAKITGTPQQGQFTSTANIPNLFRLEEMIAQLSAPAWPEKILGQLDQEKVQRGKELYAAHCAACHSSRDAEGNFPLTSPNTNGQRFIKTVNIPVFPPDQNMIGTDATMVTNFITRKAKPGALKDLIPDGNQQAEVPAGAVLGAAVKGVVQRALAELKPDPEQLLAITGKRDASDTSAPEQLLFGYKARPLNGVWATAPFLHNGSVPSLYQLLLPAGDRLKKFPVGSLEFDPRHVGLSIQPTEGAFEFRTVDDAGQPIPGNANSGHEGKGYTQTKKADGSYRNFTDEERWALIEYIKTLK
ncbi:MAG: di-heme-cytochrome C peroxidase, partial [Planctomycetota bacterium]